MPRLHCINMHSLSLDLVIGIRTLVWFDLHFIWKQSCILGSSGHHAWKCVIGGPRIEAHAPLSHYHDKGHGGCIHALNCATMLCLALCCCELQILQEHFADRQCSVPTGNNVSADGCILCRWPHPTAGGDFIQPVMSSSTQGCSSEVLAASRGVKEGKQWQPMHRGAFPEAVYLFS